MKANLRSKDGSNIALCGVETTVGREDTDIILRYPNIEVKHAIFVFNKEEQCFVLQDLNTSHGCYVNDTRIQNAAVRLAHGDLIGFGYGNPVFEFQLCRDPVYSPPHPITSEKMWESRYQSSSAGVRGNSSFLPYLPISAALEEQSPVASGSTSLPHNIATTQENPTLWAAKTLKSTCVPRPPVHASCAGVSQRSRPVSANSRISTVSSSYRGNWACSSKEGREKIAQINQVEELEQRLLRMGDELSRLSCYESECHRKDRVISELRDEISELKKYQIDTSDGQPSFTSSRANLQEEISELHNNLCIKQEAERTTSHKLVAFQSQLHQKNKEITSLKQRLDDLTQSQNGGWMQNIENDENVSTNTIAVLRTELAAKDKSVAHLKNEMEKISKQQSHSKTLMNTLQKENLAKDTLLQHAKTDIDKLKKALKEKEAILASVSAKLTRQKAAREVELEVEKTCEELLSVKAKYQSCQKQLREKNNVISELQKEVEKCTKDVEQTLKGDKVSQMELDHAKAQFVDAQREVQLGKSELKKVEKRFDQFSKRVMEATFSSGSRKVSRKELHDDEIVDHVKHMSDERKRLAEQLDEVSDFEEQKNADKHALKLAQEEFEHCLKQIRNTLSWSGRRCSVLQTSLESLMKYEVGKEQLEWIKAVCLNLLKDELAWHEKGEQLFLKAGFDQDAINEGIPKILSKLKRDIQARDEECRKLQEKVGSMEEVHETTIRRLREELTSQEHENISTAIKETREEESEKRLEMIRNFKEKEKERIEVAVATEKRISESQYGNFEQMKKSLDGKNEECENYKVTLASIRAQHEECEEIIKKHEATKNLLRKELEDNSSLLDEKTKELEKQLVDYRTNTENEVASYKEQAHQHALTIVALEERMLRLSKQSKVFEQEQIARQQLALLSPKRSRPVSPKKVSSRPSSPNKARSVSPVKEEKPPSICVYTQTVQQNHSEEILKAEVFKLEQLVLLLRREAAEGKRESVNHAEIVVGLKRDLAGALARLSDVTGELSDQQKQQVEEYKEKIDVQHRDLCEQREQLKKLSALVDFQKSEIERYKKDIDGEKEIHLNGMDKSEKQRQKRFEQEIEERKTFVDGKEDSCHGDMHTIAERCHGEKHTLVIAKQKEALREMRQRMKKLEQFRPPLPTHEQALQKITCLKNELSELRAIEAGRAEDFNRNSNELQFEVKKNRQIISQNATDMMIEKSSHEETKNALDKSEQSYLRLVRGVATLLNVLESIPECRSMIHLPLEERKVLEQERNKSFDVIQERIHNLLKHLNSKKELLKDYNKDLEKLKEIEMMAGRKSAEVDSLVTDLDSQNREANCLRVSLNRTREELDRQRRLNTSLKGKKKFSMDTKEEEPRKHSCYVDEQKRFNDELKQKKMTEKIKRKNFKIESLKKELRSADTELNNTAAELQALDPSRNFRSRNNVDSMSPETDSQQQYITIF